MGSAGASTGLALSLALSLHLSPHISGEPSTGSTSIAAISGVVLGAQTGQEVEGAVYRAIQGRGQVGTTPRVTTDEKAHFVSRSLRASADLVVRASESGYCDLANGATGVRDSGKPREVAG